MSDGKTIDKTATGRRSGVLTAYALALESCVVMAVHPLSAGVNPVTGEPVTIGQLLRSAIGAPLPPLTMAEANELAMTTIYSTSDVFNAFA